MAGMGGEDNGLTLEGLAQKLEALERENERMRSENAELRSEIAALKGLGTRRDGEPASELSESSVTEEQVSRRWLLSKAGTAAVAAVAAGTLLNTREAKAHSSTSIGSFNAIFAHEVEAENHRTNTPALQASAKTTHDFAAWGAVDAENFGTGPGVRGRSETAAVQGIATGLSGTGVEGKTEGSNGTGVKGTGRYGVWGESNQAGFYGVTGRNTRTDGTGVRGVGAKRGVLGESTNGIGVYGTSSAANLGAVEGHNNGGGTGVAGVGRVGMLAFSHTDGWIASWGRHTSKGIGVAGDSAKGTGVSGESASGYGGQFKGGKAQLRLVPKGSAGPPTGAHAKGEIYMDNAGTLFVCTAGGTTPTWRRVNTTAV